MVKLLKYFLSIGIATSLLLSCNHMEYYKRDLSAVEKAEYADIFSIGSLGSYQGSPDEMMVILEAIQLDSNAAALRERAIPYLKRGFGIKQKEYNDQALKQDPSSWLGYAGYNYMYFYRDYKIAIELFNAIDTLTPNFVDYPQAQSIDLMRGLCYLKLNNLPEAKRLLQKYIDYETSTSGRDFVDARGFLYLGIAQMQEQNYVEAIATFEEGLQVDRNNAEMLFQIAKCNLSMNDKTLASKVLDQVELQIQNENQFTRDYVDEFYQVHEGHIKDLRLELDHKS